MNVSLTPELEQFIQSQIESGKYATATQVIVDALKVFARWHEDFGDIPR